MMKKLHLNSKNNLKNLIHILGGFLIFFASNTGFSQAKIVNHNRLNSPQIIQFDQVQEQPSFEQWQVLLKKMVSYSANSQWKIYSELRDGQNEVHYRVQHYYQGVPVRLSMGVVHSKMGRIRMINGDFVPEAKLGGRAVISKDAARDIALKKFPAKKYYWQEPGYNQMLQRITGKKDTSYFPVGSLEYCAREMDLEKDFRLCYRFDVLAIDSLFGKSIYIDAETGDLVATNELILHTDVKGTAVTKFSGTRSITTDSVAPGSYRLREASRGKGIETYNMKTGKTYTAAVDFTDADNYWNNVNAQKDEVATDAHWGAAQTYDYYFGEHGRNSFDNNGAKIYSFVHFDVNYDNAFWDGYVMSYGDGSGGTFKAPLTALDVCGHEITHAVTSYTASLAYSYESGALNESFSDVFGQTIEQWSRPTQYSWKIGEDITANAGIRDMSNPNLKSQPKYYKGNLWYSGTGDNGGVHYNSGVMNYWYYLLSEGITGVNEKGNAFLIDSLGIRKAAAITYRTLSVYLTSSAQYADARTYSILSAMDLFGMCSNEVVQVTNAWWVCGVGAKYDSAYVKANFSADTMICRTGMNVNFYNKSENYKSSLWRFGDGSTSTLTQPVHSYNNYGMYKVTLVVQSCFKGKQDSMIKVNYMKVDSTFDICNAFLLPKSGIDSAIGCKGFVYDEGGEGNYLGNNSRRFKLKLPGADSIRLRFKVLDYETNFDSLFLYNGVETVAKRIGQYTGSTLPNGGNWFSVAGNTLIFKEFADQMVEGKGFKVEYVGVFKPLNVDLQKDTILCFGNPIRLKAVVSGGRTYQYSYNWKGIGTFGNKDSQLISPAVLSDQYRVVVWDGCANKRDTAWQKLTVKPRLSVKIQASDTQVCVGKSIVLRAKYSGGDTSKYVFTWNGNVGLDSLKIDFPVADTFQVKLTLSDGCSVGIAKDSIMVKTYEAIGLKMSNDTTICYGTSVFVNAIVTGGDRIHGGPGFYTIWSNGFTSGGITVSPIVKTTYYVRGGEGCSIEANDSVTVDVLPALYVSSVKDTTLCWGQSYDIQLIDTGGIAAKRVITWSDPTLVGNAVTIKPTSAGIYNYSVHVGDGCTVPSDTSDFTVTMLSPISASMVIMEDTLCYGDSVHVTFAVSGGKMSALNWTVNGSAITGNAIDDVLFSNIEYILEAKDGCSPDSILKDSVWVSPSKVQVDLVSSDTWVCPKAADGFIQVQESGGKLPVILSWNNVTLGSATKITNLGPAKYTVYAVDAFGCSDSLVVGVGVRGKQIFASFDTTIYRGSLGRLVASSGWLWKWSPTVAMETTDSLQFANVRPVKSQVYYLRAMDSAGCIWYDTLRVDVVDPPFVRIPNIITPNGVDPGIWFTELHCIKMIGRHSVQMVLNYRLEYIFIT